MRLVSIERHTNKVHIISPKKSVILSARHVKGREEGNSKDLRELVFSFANSLKVCARKKDLCKGSSVHAAIRDCGLLGKDAFLGTMLVSMYAKCGALDRAAQVLDETPIQSVSSWSALIEGYARCGQVKEAVNCLHQMQRNGLSPDAITYAYVLKGCGITQDIVIGRKIHKEIISRMPLEENVMLGTALVDMYTKCGSFIKAQKVFDGLPLRTVASWSALMAGYVQHGRGKEALGCFRRMRAEGLSPDAIMYVYILKACGITQDLELGKEIQDEIVGRGLLQKKSALGTALVDMYARSGLLAQAQTVLNTLPIRSIPSWSALIAGYVRHEKGKEALGCFHQMQKDGLFPDAITYAHILKACGITQDVATGKKIHDEIVSQGILETNLVLGTALLDMYAKCGLLVKAQNVLEELPFRDVVSWSALISGYVQHGQGKEALGCFAQMKREGLSPDAITYACILKACGITQDIDLGKKIHEEIANQSLLKKNVVLGTALIDMYAKCGVLTKAQEVIDELSGRTLVSWSALIAGYVRQGQGEEAVRCFHRMRSEGLSPNEIIYCYILKACGIIQDIDLGKKIHEEIANQALLEDNFVLGTALVDMYAKCGVLVKAKIIFDELPIRDVVAWSALIKGHAQQGQAQEALNCFQRMRTEALSPDAITYAFILKALVIIQGVGMGKHIHVEVNSQGLLKEAMLGNALVDMYAKCGLLPKAQKVLQELPHRDVISWSALIAGHAQQGHGQEALNCFQQMKSEGLSPNVVSWSSLIGGYAQQGLAKEALDCYRLMEEEGTLPDAITFVSVLSACSHAGLVDEGQMYFDSMTEKYGIRPYKEHYTCMVDLFGRARLFDKAMRIIKMMPSSDYPPLWFALLSACRKWGNVKLGRYSFERALQIGGCKPAAYVLMSNIYATAGMHEEARNIELMGIENGSQKQAGGCSCWVDATGKVHKFVFGDTKHPQSKLIYAKLEELELNLSQQGYIPTFHGYSQNPPIEAVGVLLGQHAEKLAIACALINSPQGEDIRIMNKIAVCKNCHSSISLIAKKEKRKIMIKDSKGLHIFDNGNCSCDQDKEIR